MKEKKKLKLDKQDVANLCLKLMQERLPKKMEMLKLHAEIRELKRRNYNLGREIAAFNNEVDRHVADLSS